MAAAAANHIHDLRKEVILLFVEVGIGPLFGRGVFHGVDLLQLSLDLVQVIHDFSGNEARAFVNAQSGELGIVIICMWATSGGIAIICIWVTSRGDRQISRSGWSKESMFGFLRCAGIDERHGPPMRQPTRLEQRSLKIEVGQNGRLLDERLDGSSWKNNWECGGFCGEICLCWHMLKVKSRDPPG
jgi:hypothetical protein